MRNETMPDATILPSSQSGSGLSGREATSMKIDAGSSAFPDFGEHERLWALVSCESP
jgi:hypothetical protein